MRSQAWVVPLCVLLLELPPSRATAACNQLGAGLGCFDATPGQGPAEPTSFQWFAEGKVLPAESFALKLHYRYANRPLRIVAPSTMPSGRPLDVVSQTTRLELRAAAGLGSGLDASFVLPVGLAQEGTGSESLSSQTPDSIDTGGFGDVRLALRSQLPSPFRYLDWTLMLEMTLPTGNEEAYLGAPGAAEAITTNLAFHYKWLVVVADLGARVTKPRQFADVVIGPHLLAGLGMAAHVLSKERLTVALEGQVRPMLSSAPELESTDYYPIRSHATWVMPAEWMLSVSSRPSKEPVWVSLGAGTALALSRREVERPTSSSATWLDPRVTDSFYAPTSPRFTIAGSIATRL